MKRFCRWILEDEITNLRTSLKNKEMLAHRLTTRLLPYKPPLIPNGEDMSEILNFHLDIAVGLKENLQIPKGEFLLDNTLNLGTEVRGTEINNTGGVE